MSGGKETPRQKMINLMYLVLIAMLALQVSSTVIFKFEQLNQNLELGNDDTSKNNAKKLSKIGLEIKSKKNATEQLAYLKKADEIRRRTSSISDYMHQLKNMLIEETGGYDEKGNLKGAKEETKVEVVMLGGNKNGKAYELKQKLDEHIKWLNQQGFGSFDNIALDAENHPIYKGKADQANKDFADLNFSNAPLVATLATISELESSVLDIERVILGTIADSINMKEYKVGELIPMVKTTSNYIVAGKTYEADLFLTAQLATETPEMYLGSSPLEVDQSGLGKVKFKATGGNFDNSGTLKKTWKGKIRVKKPNGQDTIYEVEQEYIVAKPTLQFQAASVQALYANCGNKMNVSVPELGMEFNPTYQITGGVIERGNSRGKVTIIPTSSNVKLKVFSDGTPIGEQRFEVRKVPLPNVEVKKGNSSIHPQRGITTSEIRNLKIDIDPNEDLKRFLPEETKYRVTNWEATWARGSRKKGSKTGSGSNLRAIANEFRQAQSGDRIIIEIKEMKRLNYRGQTEKVNLPNTSRFITIPIG